jgi:hypothetical protein
MPSVVASGRRAPPVTPEQEESWISSLALNTGSAIEQLGLALDTPGAIARGVMAGDPLSGFNWDYDKRTSGEELLQSYGLVGENTNPYLKTAAGFGAELVTDPLAWITTPMSSLTKAGKAAKAAGILDLAPIAAQNRMGSAARSTMTGRLADDALNRLLPMGLGNTAENAAIRPFVGPRVARTTTTLGEVVQAAKNPQDALADVLTYLNKKGIDYDAVKDERLGGAIGFGFGSPFATFTPTGSGKVLDAMDALGQAAAWSYPSRLASSVFDQRVSGAIDPGDQIAAMRQFDALDTARSEGRRAAALHTETVAGLRLSDRARNLLGSDSLLSPQGNDFLTRAFEGKVTATDRALMREIPGINTALSSWDRLRRANISKAQSLGMDIAQLRDPRFGVEYSPRSGTELDFQEYATGFGRSMFESRVMEDMSRKPYLFTPGGTVDLREVSRLPLVRQWAKDGSASQYSVAQVGNEIATYINRKHGVRAIDQAQGEAIARTMWRLNKDLPNNIPIFAGHPINEQARVIINQEVARANANFVFDSLVESAVPMNANMIAGSGFKNLSQATNEIAGRVGLKAGAAGMDPDVQRNLVDRLSQRLGVPPSQIDLSKVAIPEQVYNRLSRVQDFYSSPRAQQEISGMFDSVTQLWKSFLLAFPARHVRDWYSNIASVWLETGDPLATTKGFALAKSILAGDIDSVLPQIAQLPQYQGIGNLDAVRSKFYGDVGAAGILTGLAQADTLAAKRSGELSRLLPGVSPVSRIGSFKELIPDGSRNPLQMAQDFLTIRGDAPYMNKFETRNPLLNWSAKLTDANDSIARLGGWLALLDQGVSGPTAAKRMQNALVNYESLTPIERGFLRKIFPWYSYTSRIGKYVAQSLIENPGGLYGQTIRGMNTLQQSNDNVYVPQRLRQQLSFRVPDELLALIGVQQDPGTNTFLTDFDLPGIDALSMIDPTSVQGTIKNLAGQTNPFVKGLAELAFDQDLFSKRRLSDADPAINKVYRGLTGGELSNVAKVVGSNLPGVQRVAGIAGSLLDDQYPMRLKLPKTILNSVAGFKANTVTPEYRDSDALQTLTGQMGDVAGTMTITYPDKEKLAKASPEMQQKAQLWSYLKNKQSKAAAERKKQQSFTTINQLTQ